MPNTTNELNILNTTPSLTLSLFIKKKININKYTKKIQTQNLTNTNIYNTHGVYNFFLQIYKKILFSYKITKHHKIHLTNTTIVVLSMLIVKSNLSTMNTISFPTMDYR